MPSTISPLATFSPAVNSRAWSSAPHPHLPLVATACADRSVRVYSLADFRQHSAVAGGHRRSVRACAWKPGPVTAAADADTVLATASFDASVGIWRRRVDADVAAEGGVRERRGKSDELDFTAGLAGGDGDGAAGDADDDDDDEWRFAVVLDGHDSEIKSVAFSPTAPLLATCSRDKSVWIWEELDDDNFETVAVLQEHDGDVKAVAWHPAEQLLASASYDDDVRLWAEDADDWACCALLSGHGGTVWWVEFEAAEAKGALLRGDEARSDEQKTLLELRARVGPRLLSCSDDLSVRVWRRVPKERQAPPPPTGQGRMPSIWKNKDFEQDWVEDARLPAAHDRAVYAVSWSRTTGRVVSCGGDGKIVVYEERWKEDAGGHGSGDVDMTVTESTPAQTHQADTTDATAKATAGAPKVDRPTLPSLTEWHIVAEFENAHDVFEINHVVWAPRADKGRRHDSEEIIISTGDDGEVKVWTVDD